MRKAKKDKMAEILSQPQVYGSIVAAHVQAFCRFAALAIQGCFLLNATVGIAAFAQRAKSIWPILPCAAGAILAICAAYLAYKAQFYFAREDSARLRAYMDAERGSFMRVEISASHATAERKAEASFSACVLSLMLFILALLSLFTVES